MIKNECVRKKVICLDTNVVYNGVLECARTLNIPQGNLVACLKGRVKSVCGMHFKYYDKED